MYKSLHRDIVDRNTVLFLNGAHWGLGDPAKAASVLSLLKILISGGGVELVYELFDVNEQREDDDDFAAVNVGEVADDGRRQPERDPIQLDGETDLLVGRIQVSHDVREVGHVAVA